MHLSDFRFDLPAGLIAQRPLTQRSSSRLLSLEGSTGTVRDLLFTDFPGLLCPGDLLVLNDTQVMRARLFGRKPTGGKVEILIERVLTDTDVLAQVRANKSLKVGGQIILDGNEALEVCARDGDLFRLQALSGTFPVLMERHGHMPLPPYIERPDDAADMERYQTVYASREGAVAAPTAGLHFEQSVLERLEDRGVGLARVTLHVGAGTFQPVRVARLEDHVMHSEWVEVDGATCDRVRAVQEAGGRVVAVGTTSVRSLESAAQQGELRPFRGETRLFIRPGYRFRVVDALVTNFHLPESTLLMLVAAFAGYDAVMAAYRHAVAKRYRFFSYGDAMFLTRRD